jgi:hypothetical protein
MPISTPTLQAEKKAPIRLTSEQEKIRIKWLEDLADVEGERGNDLAHIAAEVFAEANARGESPTALAVITEARKRLQEQDEQDEQGEIAEETTEFHLQFEEVLSNTMIKDEIIAVHS